MVAGLALGLLAGRATPTWAGQDICPEPNDAPENACAIGPNTSSGGYLDSPDDVDRYRISIGEGQSVQATLGTLPGSYTFRLEAEDGTVVADGNGSGTDDRALGANGLTGGTYYVVVRSDGGDSSADQAYTLRVSVQGAVAGPGPSIDPNAPPPPPAQERTLDQLALFGDEGGDHAKASGTTKGSDSRASWYQITYKRADGDAKFGPLITVNRVYRAVDLSTAQQIFQEQTKAGLPEAKELNLSFNSLGPQPMDPVGEEAQAVGALAGSRGDIMTRHYRIVFRMGNLVETLYTYGPETGNYFGVAMGFAKTIEKRINTAPNGPAQEIFSNRQPADIGLHVNEAGKQATEKFTRTGSDDRGSWYEARFERDDETIGERLGPTHLYNKVFVANSNANARDIYQENAVFDLPESTRPHGAIFDEPKTKSFGNESYAIGACNNDCGDQFSDKLHERLVVRWGNVVIILYTWGREDQSNPDNIGDYANTLMGRVR